MNSKSSALLDDLRQTEFFSKVGTVRSMTTAAASSWSAANVHCVSGVWGQLRDLAIDKCKARLLKANWDLLLERHDLIETITPKIGLIIKDKMEIFPLTNDSIYSIRLDITHACIENHFHHITGESFFTDTLEFYRQGHFPCGWEWKAPPAPGWSWKDITQLGRYIVF